LTAVFAQLLTIGQVEQVHEASLEILEYVGMLVRNQEARELYVEHGCVEDLETQIIKFPRAVIEHFRQAIPPTFTFHGRDPSYDCTIPGSGPLVSTGSSAPDIIDIQTGQVRRSRSDDIARIAYLINELPGYDIFSISVTADDAPEGQFSLSRFYPTLKNCLKPVYGSAPSMDEIQDIVKLGVLIAGSEAAFWERPFVTFGYCPVISPLTMDVESTEKLLHFTELGIPCYGVVAPTAGLSAPLTLTGMLALTNAEFLAQATLEQIIRPGKPIIYETLPTVVDIRTGAYSPGGIETGILLMGCTQMANYYNIPSGGFVGLTNAKFNNAQSGFETGMSTTAALLAGIDLLRFGGLLDALMVFDFAKAMIDNEIALMLKQTARGLQFSEDNLALDTISEAGPGGTFMNKTHTIDRMRSTALLSEIANRLPRQQWERNGAPDPQNIAMQRVREILTGDNPAVFSPNVDDSIRAEFEGLVAGDAIPVESRVKSI
jgi:trimethylamine--corrinoid protein Co-methyltransferase